MVAEPSTFRPADTSYPPRAVPAGWPHSLVAWVVVLLVSDVPEVVWQLWTGAWPAQLVWLQVGGVLALAGFACSWKRLSYLRALCLLLTILVVGQRLGRWLDLTPAYVQQGPPSELLLRLGQFEAWRMAIALAMVTASFATGKRRHDLCLAKGVVGKWKVPGIAIGLMVMGFTFLFFGYDWPSPVSIVVSSPVIVAALTMGALAALDEEVRYRATMLPVVADLAGRNQAALMTAALFGVGHYFGGVPSGFEGVAIAGALGWLYAVMTLQTRSIGLAWFNHFLTNVPTFLFWAVAGQ